MNFHSCVISLLFLCLVVVSASRTAVCPLRRTDNGDLVVQIKIGSPARDVLMLVDFQSEISGIWTDDLGITSKSFCEVCSPTTRE